MERSITLFLQNWTTDDNRKVALLRGARQVGKTYTIRELGNKFQHFLEINFEENPTILSFFVESLDPQVICENLSAYYGTPIIPGKTLLFFDEIQSCLPAIQSLRFFHEKMPDLHVIAAGSLLEFALEELPTFGVGRIQSYFMYPMNFEEFLLANKEDGLLSLMKKASPTILLASPIHEKLVFYLKRYLLIGGLPEVVKTFVSTRDLNKCQETLDTLLLGYYDDFAKYKSRVPAIRLRDIFLSIARQSGSKFKYSNAISNANHGQIKEGLDLLCLAGIAYRIYHTSANGLPLGAEVNVKKFKVLLFDIGLQQRMLGLNLGELLVKNDFDSINKGNLAELFVGLELYRKSVIKWAEVYYWHRESKSSNAEIDYIIQDGDKLLPIEVKAGTKGQMQSMHLFLKEKNCTRGLRMSLENFSSYPPIDVYPMYATGIADLS